MMTNQRYKGRFILLAIIFLLVIALPLFINLGKLPIRIWDEARLAINAYEMKKSGNLLVTSFEGSPDMWNTKPPLMIWLQSASISFLGYNEFALRLPSAVAAFVTCILLVGFSKRAFNTFLPGVLASLVLVTINGYVHIHAARTGDYDALLALFTSGFLLAGFLFIETGKKKYLHLFFLCIALALLTKSVQGLIFLPGLGLYLVIQKKLMLFLRNKWFYIDALLVIIFAGGYYFLRELYNPGYLQAIWENELGGRYLNTLEENKAGKGY
ncbi:MAG TPA: glycosyltransferase family 39 protein, partial [Chitinophagaceae bacterium]|nr:glycosyltransferase family 39 protein [Chitinophagaceae bacterium]